MAAEPLLWGHFEAQLEMAALKLEIAALNPLGSHYVLEMDARKLTRSHCALDIASPKP